MENNFAKLPRVFKKAAVLYYTVGIIFHIYFERAYFAHRRACRYEFKILNSWMTALTREKPGHVMKYGSHSHEMGINGSQIQPDRKYFSIHLIVGLSCYYSKLIFNS